MTLVFHITVGLLDYIHGFEQKLDSVWPTRFDVFS